MKLLKYALLTLLVAIVTDGIVTYAVSTSSVFGSYELSGNSQLVGNYAEKEYAGQQKYTNQKTYTALTNPCENCHVTVIVENSEGADSGGITLASGETGYFNNTATYVTGNYRLKLRRVEASLLTTSNYYQWYINNN